MRNMGTFDRTIRILFAVVVGLLYVSDLLSGLAATILGLLSVVFLLTGIIGFCPLYASFKFSTVKRSGTRPAKPISS